MKSVYRISVKQHGGIKPGISQFKNSTVLLVIRDGALSCWKV